MRDSREILAYFERMMAQARDPREAMEIMRSYQRELDHYGMSPFPSSAPLMYSAGIAGMLGETASSKPLKPLPEEHMVAALVGFRAWNVPLFVDELRSVAKASKWKPFQRFEAECESNQCSGVSCQCGIYAFSKMEFVQSEYKSADRTKRYVYGECWLWGRVLECDKGFRAQFAYPKALVDNGAIAKRMAEVFGIPLLATKP